MTPTLTAARRALSRLRGDALRIALTAGLLAVAADTADRHLAQAVSRPAGGQLLRAALRLAVAAQPARPHALTR